MTSADIVLPVPESPANSAVTPRPRPPPRAHPPLAEDLRRGAGRAARSRAAASPSRAAARGRAQPTAGSMRRASRSRPTAFCARTPCARSVAVDRGAPYRGVQRGRPGRPDDLVGGEHELGGRGGGIECRAGTVRGSTVERRAQPGAPQGGTRVGPEHRGVELQRRLRRPERVPRHPAGEDDRRRRPAPGCNKACLVCCGECGKDPPVPAR